MSWDVVLRLINTGMGLIALVLLYIAGHRNWHRYTVKMKNYYMALGGFCSLIVEANVEILLGLDIGPRIVLTTGVLAFTITGLLRHEGYTIDEQKPSSSDPPSK